MKLKDMKVGIRYKAVTNGSTIYIGESVMLLESGNLYSYQTQGVLLPSNWKHLRNEVEVDMAYCEFKLAEALELVDKYQKVLEEARTVCK